jgi:hypothetical protein
MTQQTVNLPQAILAKLEVLPPAQQQEILDFAEFLIQKYEQALPEKASAGKQRILGLDEGKVWMSEDFDDPLPDEFWFGEEDSSSKEAHSESP